MYVCVYIYIYIYTRKHKYTCICKYIYLYIYTQLCFPCLGLQCLGQCWYTAVDTQLYLVAPLVLLPLAFYPSKGIVVLPAFARASKF